MSQKWKTMKQLRDDLPEGCRAEKSGFGSVQIDIYDASGSCIAHAGTGQNKLGPVLKDLESAAAGVRFKSNRRE